MLSLCLTVAAGLNKLPEVAMNAKTIIIGLVILAVVVSVILTCNQGG